MAPGSSVWRCHAGEWRAVCYVFQTLGDRDPTPAHFGGADRGRAGSEGSVLISVWQGGVSVAVLSTGTSATSAILTGSCSGSLPRARAQGSCALWGVSALLSVPCQSSSSLQTGSSSLSAVPAQCLRPPYSQKPCPGEAAVNFFAS